MNPKDEIREWTIYKITSPSGRVYVGKTINIKNRVSSYKSALAHSQKLLNKSFLKYGFASHDVCIIDSFIGDNNFASGKEMFWIRSYMSHKNKFPEQRGMNLTDGGEGRSGCVTSKETKEKQSLAKIGKPPHNKGKVGMQVAWNKGIKTGLPSWSSGKDFSYLSEDERKERFGKHNLGNSYNKGRKHSEEYCEKMRSIKLGTTVEKLRKPIIQLSLNGDFIAEYSSLKEAQDKTGITTTTISQIAKGIRLKPRNFLFKFKL